MKRLKCLCGEHRIVISLLGGLSLALAVCVISGKWLPASILAYLLLVLICTCICVNRAAYEDPVRPGSYLKQNNRTRSHAHQRVNDRRED